MSVKARVPGNARLKELPQVVVRVRARVRANPNHPNPHPDSNPNQVVVEARGYGVTRTVPLADLRPPS